MTLSANIHKKLKMAAICFGVIMFGLFFAAMPSVKAEGFDYNTWITAEKTKYPAGKYWNHVGLNVDNSEGYTEKPCSLHGTSGVDHVYGTGGCTCNHFADPGISGTATYPAVWHYSATQCMGFANKLGYDMFGSTMWSRITVSSDSNYKNNIRVGDIVRINGHSSFVISKSTDNKITVGECNYTSKANGCLIAWDRTIDLATVSSFEYYERAQNYDGIVSGTIAPTQASEDKSTTESKDGTTDNSYTGWKLAEDGDHYMYIKDDKVLSEQWIKIGKKKYYIDENGFRVTGLYEIGGKKYYFNGSGVLQKKKWITISKNTYYIGSSGYALKSQWLYKGKVLVYVKSNCVMAKSELVKISGSTYYFNSKGKRSKGFKKCNNKYYYCNSYGIILKKQWITKGKKKYYVDKKGVRVADKLVKISGSRYYFNSKGVMERNKEIEFEGKIYKANKYGQCTFVDYAEDSTTEVNQ